MNNLIVVSDLHIGCQLGLCPPEGFPLDQGGTYRPNELQRATWKMWRYIWDVWAPDVCRGEPYSVALNGDLIDGEHHGNTCVWTSNIACQRFAASSLLGRERDKWAKLYVLRGTPVHDGESGRECEALARDLDAKPSPSGQHARYELTLKVGNARVHLAHHIGTTSSAAHEASAVNAELTSQYVEAARWGDQKPDCLIRSHRHRCIVVEIDSDHGVAAGVVTPGWQGKTPFCSRIAGSRNARPQFGAILIRQGDEEHYMRRKVFSIPPPGAEEI